MKTLDEMADEWQAKLTTKDYGTMDLPGSLSFKSAFAAGARAMLEHEAVVGMRAALANINGNIPGSTKYLKTRTPMLWECMTDNTNALAAFDTLVSAQPPPKPKEE